MNDNETRKMKRVPISGTAAGWVALLLGFGFAGFSLGCDAQADPTYKGDPLLSVTGQVSSALSVGDVQVGILWLTSGREFEPSDFDHICTGNATTPNGAPSACVAACGEVTCAGLDSWGQCAGNCPDVTNVEILDQSPNPPLFIGGVGQTTPAIGEFPAQFSLDILSPPPDEALIGSTTGERLAIGMFVALDPAGAPWHFELPQLPNDDPLQRPPFPDWLLGGSERDVLAYAPDGIPDSSIWAQLTGQPLSPGYHFVELPAWDDDVSPAVIDANPSQAQLIIGPPDTIHWPFLWGS